MQETLKSIPIFKDLDQQDLALVSDLLVPIEFAKGDTIFRQGEIGDAMYLVHTGQLVVWNDHADAALAYLGPGSFAGELALLLAEPRSATLKVAIDTELFILKKQDFDQLLERRPSIAVHMTREMGKRLVKTSQQRFVPKARRISALWGIDDNGDLIKTLCQHLENSVVVIPLPNTFPHRNLRQTANIFILNDPDLDAENLAGQLGVQLENYRHIILLLPKNNADVAQKALDLSDTVISIGKPPAWITDNVPPTQMWITTNSAINLQRIARRLTGRTVGLALSSGGGKGLAHIGVMNVLHNAGIPIDMVSGTSAGAFFGAVYHIHQGTDRMNNFAAEIQTMNKWVNWDINFPPKAGILKGAKARDLIDSLVENKRFEDLEIPHFFVAADIMTGERVVFEHGKLSEAVRASLSIPMLADPWRVGDRYLIDGAFVDPIPADILRERGADIIIASSVIQSLQTQNGHRQTTKMPHFLKIITNIQTMVEEQLVSNQEAFIDVMIQSKVAVDHALDFENAETIVAAGEKAANAMLPTIQAYLDTPAE